KKRAIRAGSTMQESRNYSFYSIRDILQDAKGRKQIDVYLETPGGSGTAAEEIVKFLRTTFETVSFVVSGEAKSAGTIMVLGGDEILLTETGSLGPIDAQVRVGRSIVSAHDYMEWVDRTRRKAARLQKLNPFDATMVAQMDPGELLGVKHALEYARDLVVDWLPRYKFRNWTKTETRGAPVTDQMKKKRAREIAKDLTNHARWRQHGRSIKADDLESIGLKVTRLDEDEKLADIAYRIHTVLRLLFSSSSVVKILRSHDTKLEITRTQSRPPAQPISPTIPTGIVARPDVVTVEPRCDKCGKVHRLYAKFVNQPQIDQDFQAQGFTPIPKDNKLTCDCGAELDLSAIVNQIEIQDGRKILTK
ncbi:ATP-dependent Clp protease proteolytic subunit, partial [Thermodesulfobacteriota bacterium]